MKTRITLSLLFCLFALPLTVLAAQSKKCDYVEYQRLPLTKEQNGIDGSLVIMRDRKVLSSKDYHPLEVESYCNARLNLVNLDNRKIATQNLERPVAEIKTVKLIDGKPKSFSLEVDYSAGWGSYSGPVTMFIDVVGGKIKWIRAKDASNGKTEKISVMISLKTYWKLSPSKKKQDILELACRPTGNGDFELIYSRYSFNGLEWIRYSRSEKGYLDFEADTDFPRENLFPPRSFSK
jgi:hypothetical protein